MDYDDALEIWRSICASGLADLRGELVEAAVRYARMRVDDLLAEPEKQRWVGHDRSVAHDALISRCDILARNMAQRGEDANWRQHLGSDRKAIGDFGCYLHAILGISAR